jgi:hypothetical protein
LVIATDGTLTMNPQLRNALNFPDAPVRYAERELRDVVLGRQPMVIFCGDGYSGVKLYATWSQVTIPAGSGHLKL